MSHLASTLKDVRMIVLICLCAFGTIGKPVRAVAQGLEVKAESKMRYIVYNGGEVYSIYTTCTSTPQANYAHSTEPEWIWMFVERIDRIEKNSVAISMNLIEPELKDLIFNEIYSTLIQTSFYRSKVMSEDRMTLWINFNGKLIPY